jgi:sensor histidine kinase YesM
MMGKRPLVVMQFACAIAVFIGLCYAVQMRIVEGKEFSWKTAIIQHISFWIIWGLLAGPIAWLVHRFPIARGRSKNALYHLAASALASPLHSLLYYLVSYVTYQQPAYMLMPHFVLAGFLRGIIYYWLIVAISHALDYYVQYEEKALAASQLESQLAQAQLQALKMQLHPHFLFNTLNSISALLRHDVETADLMIERLGDFLRMTLDNPGAQDVTLKEELDFLSCYLSIEKIRLQDRLDTQIDVEPQVLDARVPNLILQPIVENAIRHGIAPRSTPGRVEIAARRHRSMLLMCVRDNGPGIRSPNGEGVGLSNTRARLARLYGSGYRFELENAPEGGLVVTLEIPFQYERDSHPDRG